MEEIHKLRAQISSIVQTNFPDTDSEFAANIKPPNKLQVSSLYNGKNVILTDDDLVKSPQTTSCCWLH
jgi:hypothetical protein